MLRYKCGSGLVQVKFTHTYLLKQTLPSLSWVQGWVLKCPSVNIPIWLRFPTTLGFIYGFLKFSLTEGLFFSLPMWADWFSAPAHFQIWREKLRGEFVSIFKIGDTKWAWLDYFMETLHFTSNLFWKRRLPPESCRFWVTWCSQLFLNINVIWTVDT